MSFLLYIVFLLSFFIYINISEINRVYFKSNKALIDTINNNLGNLAQDGKVTRYTTSQLVMDGVFDWIMNSPNNTMVSKLVNCQFSYDTISGELNGGVFLLIGYRSGVYAHITACSYWNNRSISVGIIENGAWAKRFDKVITSTDLQTHYPVVLHFAIEPNTYKIIKEKGIDRFTQLLFLQGANINGHGFYLLSGYGEGGANRYNFAEIASGGQYDVEINGTSFKVTNNVTSASGATLVCFRGNTPIIE